MTLRYDPPRLAMRYRLLAPLFVSLAAACAGSCAGTNNGIEDPPPPPPPPVAKSYVAIDGDDASDGSQATPFRTLAHAIDVGHDWIVVGPGTFAEREISVARRLRIEGDESATILDGHLLVASNNVQVSRINVRGGIAISLSDNVIIENATVTYGLEDDAISVNASLVTLRGLGVQCGPETCIQVTTSTATLEGIDMTSAIAAKRGLRVESSSVSASQITATKMNTAQIQVAQNSRVVLKNANLSDSSGSGLVVIGSSTVLADHLTTSALSKFSVLIQESNVTVRESMLGTTGSITMGIQAGTVALFQTVVAGSPEGTISINARSGRPPTVRIVDGEIRQGSAPGLLHGGGLLRVEGTRFIGDDTAPANIDDRDAIVTSGMDTELIVTNSTFERPVGSAVIVREHAKATITATITGARTSGILIDTARVNPIVIRNGRIDDCVRESGVAVFDAEQVTIDGLTVTGCTESGVLAGADSVIDVQHTKALDNPGFGYAAFGGSLIHLSNSSARGSQWATFATCADGAQVLDEGNNQLDGAVTECP